KEGKKFALSALNPCVARLCDTLVDLANVQDPAAIGTDSLRGIVRGSVVDDDYFVGLTGLGENTFQRSPDVRRLIVRGDDYANAWVPGHCPMVILPHLHRDDKHLPLAIPKPRGAATCASCGGKRMTYVCWPGTFGRRPESVAVSCAWL